MTKKEKTKDYIPFMDKYFPESISLAIILSLITLLVSLVTLEPINAFESLSTGFFNHLRLQMAIILWWVLPVIIIESERYGVLLDKITRKTPKEENTIYLTTSLIAILLGWVNWAFGFLSAILIGKKLQKDAEKQNKEIKTTPIFFSSLIAIVVGQIGLTGIGALIATQGFLETKTIEITTYITNPGTISLFLMTSIGGTALVLVLNKLMNSKEPKKSFSLKDSISQKLSHYEVPPRTEWAPAEKLEYSSVLSIIAVIIGAISIIWIISTRQPNMLDFLFILVILGLAAQKNPMAFMEKARESTKWANHVAIPFLLYAGIFSLLTTAKIYPILTSLFEQIPVIGSFFSSLLLGLLIPDSGSVWLILHPTITSLNSIVSSLNITMIASGISKIWLGFLFAEIIGIDGMNKKSYIKYAASFTVYLIIGSLFIFFVF